MCIETDPQVIDCRAIPVHGGHFTRTQGKYQGEQTWNEK